MRIEIITDPTPPPPKTVIITMTLQEARDLHSSCYRASDGNTDDGKQPIRLLVDALTKAGIKIA